VGAPRIQEAGSTIQNKLTEQGMNREGVRYQSKGKGGKEKGRVGEGGG